MGLMLKYFAYFIAVAVALLVTAIITIMLLFDVNDYRDEIELVVEKKTGREFLIDGEIGKASALKMVFAANTKGTTALLSGVLAAAEKLGVRDSLEQQWSRHNPEQTEQTQARVRRVTAKAWRFAGEMEEIATTLEGAGLPDAVMAASSNPAQLLGALDRGRVAVGLRADLVELDEDLHVRRVMRSGEWLA